jgi:hypothetical protein
MGSMNIWHWLVVLAVVILAFRTMRLQNLSGDSKNLSRTPIYSAEATNGEEAEFIRDQLPSRVPIAVVVVCAALFCAAAWWLTR